MDGLINKVIVGNALTKLGHIEDNSVDMIVTSPPYWNAVCMIKMLTLITKAI